MNILGKWQAHLVSERAKGNRIVLSEVIIDYVTRYQRVTAYQLKQYIYTTVGQEWRDPLFDKMILEVAEHCVNAGRIEKNVMREYCVKL